MPDDRFDIEKIVPSEEVQIARAGYPQAGAYPGAYGSPYGEDDDKMHLGQMWRAIRKRIWLISTIVIVVTAVVTVEMFRTKSLYQANTTIELQPENRTVVKSGDFTIQADESDDLAQSAVAIRTKIRFLQSRPLLEDVVATLRLDQNPKFMDIKGKRSVSDAVSSVMSRMRPQAPPEAPIPTESGPVKLGDASDRTAAEKGKLAPYVDILAANVTADPLPDTRMFVVTFTHTDPDLSAQIVNTIAEVFRQRSFQGQTERFTNTTDWLDRTTRELKAKVEKAEEDLAVYSREHSLYSMDGKETFATQKLGRLQEQVSRAETDRILKQSMIEEVKAGRVSELPEAFVDPKLGALESKLGELETRQAELSARYGPDNPKLIEVQQEIATLHQQIDSFRSVLADKLKSDYDRAVRDEKSLNEALDRAKLEAAHQNQDVIQSSMLKQEVDTQKALYTDFLQKMNQAKVQVAEQHNNLKIIEPAQVPATPTGPNRLRTIIIGFFVSLLAALGVAVGLEYLDNTIKTVDDVTRIAQLPALGVIPTIAARKRLRLPAASATAEMSVEPDGSSMVLPGQIMAMGSRSSIAEAYRVLRTSVLLSTAGGPPKIMLVTSGQPGDGKTTTMINTAVSLAQLGSSVLMIDCDLRKPSAHKMFGIDHTQGLSTYLSRDVAIEGLIQKLPIANLSILPCGPIPPNPAELLSSEKMRKVLKELAQKYDHVIIDSPPLIHVTDPVILSTMADGVILVVHGGKSTREVLRRARAELSSVGANVLGVVLNNLDLRRQGYDQYYYQRYYAEYSNGNASS